MSFKLNSRQLQAVNAVDPVVAVVAGPGTGKTRTLIARIARLITEEKLPPEEIIAVTFTRSAAEEIKIRLADTFSGSLLKHSIRNIRAGTVHSLALEVISSGAIQIANESQKRAVAERFVSKKKVTEFLTIIRQRKQQLQEPFAHDELAYDLRLHEQGLCDYDDLLVQAIRRLKSFPRPGPQHLLIDEFQDTSLAQYEFLKRIGAAGLFIIGDPDQAIYGFGGPDFKPFERLALEFPGLRMISLVENYRSQSVIIEAAGQIISRNAAFVDRDLQAQLEAGLPVAIRPCTSASHEAGEITGRIQGLIGGGSLYAIDSGWGASESERGLYGFGDIAILYRFHALAQPITAALERAGLPFTVYGKDKDGESEAGTQADRREFVESERASPPEGRRETISLMTLHRAKGLEFPIVFIAGVESGLLPAGILGLFGKPVPCEEDERRLFYVGVTRAKKRLFLSWTKNRRLWGKTCGGPSPYLADIEERLRLIEKSKTLSKKPKPKAQPTLFDI